MMMPMGAGLHFKTGPAGIYYRQADTKTGAYEVHGTFTQMEPSEHPEAVGLFIGGSNLAAANQKYTYFLVRQDGMFMIKRRDGATTPDVMDWTASPETADQMPMAVARSSRSGKVETSSASVAG